ncbi:AlpA family transcriptional regulator [Desulfobacula sp.]|uniref:helix-turn-helix transcriptional regulator n=1 Tax=Desulfobacula sp. TaxID=2593537 RepID=UPI00260F0970|nr:AlpA family phage regulatory protein [Desulfobacula sp.]
METNRIIRKPELFKLIGVSDTTIWRWEKDGLFPKRVALGPNSSGWLESEVAAWFETKAIERSA